VNLCPICHHHHGDEPGACWGDVPDCSWDFKPLSDVTPGSSTPVRPPQGNSTPDQGPGRNSTPVPALQELLELEDGAGDGRRGNSTPVRDPQGSSTPESGADAGD
jgi:hypothetical protein